MEKYEVILKNNPNQFYSKKVNTDFRSDFFTLINEVIRLNGIINLNKKQLTDEYLIFQQNIPILIDDNKIPELQKLSCISVIRKQI